MKFMVIVKASKDSEAGKMPDEKLLTDPMPGTESEIEIRQVFAPEDFGEAFTPELREAGKKMQQEMDKKR